MLGKKDILAILHAGNPDPQSNSLGDKQRKALGGVFPSLGGGGGQQDANGQSHNRGRTNFFFGCFIKKKLFKQITKETFTDILIKL